METAFKTLLSDYVTKPQEGRKRFLFIVDSKPIAESIVGWGAQAALVRNRTEKDELVDMLNSAILTSVGCTIIPCCSKTMNDELKSDLSYSQVVCRSEYQLYGGKKGYYELNPIELDPRLEKITDEMDGIKKTGLIRSPETGLIIATTDNRYRDIAEYLIKKHDIIRLSGEIRCKKQGRIYSMYTPELNDSLLLEELDNSSVRYRNEIYTYIKKFAPERELTTGYIPFTNCVYSTKEEDVRDYAEDMYFSHCIPHRFTMECPSEEVTNMVDKFFSDIACGDDELVRLLYEIIAYSLTDGNPWQKTFFVYGNGGNGKGVYFQLLNAIFGKANVAHKNWTDLSAAKGRYGIEDKMLIICNDIDGDFVREPQALKTLTSCEPQSVKKLYQNEYTVVFRGKIISSGNSIPRVNDTSNGWQRRLVIIPFNGRFADNPDTTLGDRLSCEAAVEYIIAMAVIYLPKVLKEGFIMPKSVKQMLEEYRVENNPVLEFVQEYGDSFAGRENGKILDTIYSTMYTNFCKENNYKPLCKLGFSKRLLEAGVENKKDVKTGKRIYYLKEI